MKVIKQPFRYSSIFNEHGCPDKRGVGTFFHMQVKKHRVEKKISKKIRCVARLLFREIRVYNLNVFDMCIFTTIKINLISNVGFISCFFLNVMIKFFLKKKLRAYVLSNVFVIIELLNNKLHGISPPGGLVSPPGGFTSLSFDQGVS